MHLNEISGAVIDASYKIHTQLGPGLLESVYERVLAYELRKRGFTVETQLPVPIIYDEVYFDEGYRLDLLINESLIVEVKSIEEVVPLHKKQLLTYLRLRDKRLGLLINFNVELIKQGITRIANNLEE
jgi:GxxExxY protein